jgi:thioredoxin 1
MIVILNKENFKNEVLNSKETVLVDFFAPWCPPCRVLLPILEELAKEYEGKIKFTKLNVEDAPEIAEEYQVFSVPTLIIFKEGKEIERIVGLDKKRIEEVLNSI